MMEMGLSSLQINDSHKRIKSTSDSNDNSFKSIVFINKN
jgi:hypothetical protein